MTHATHMTKGVTCSQMHSASNTHLVLYACYHGRTVEQAIADDKLLSLKHTRKGVGLWGADLVLAQEGMAVAGVVHVLISVQDEAYRPAQ